MSEKEIKFEIDAYRESVNAAHKTDVYGGVAVVSECPYEDDSIESEYWWDGFGDGTEDFIVMQEY